LRTLGEPGVNAAHAIIRDHVVSTFATGRRSDDHTKAISTQTQFVLASKSQFSLNWEEQLNKSKMLTGLIAVAAPTG
jgi:hypothetical protein